MTLKLCEQADASDWLSVGGLQSRHDDDISGSYGGSESAESERLIIRASSIVAAHLTTRYNTIEFAGSTPPTNTPPFVKHLTAVIYAFYVCGRRLNPVSKVLHDEYERVLQYLKDLQAGKLSLPDVAESFDTLPFMTNFTHVGASFSIKIRKLPSISSGDAPDPESKRKEYPVVDLGSYPFYF